MLATSHWTSFGGQYGVRFAFLFAFMQTTSASLTVLWVFLMAGGVVLCLVDKDWYLRILGLAGLIPCVWCPIFLGRWAGFRGNYRESGIRLA